MGFVLYRKQWFMDRSFCWKHGYWGNVSRDAAKLASSSNQWRFRRLHFPKGRSSNPFAPGCSTFSEWISTSTMDRTRRERRPGASVLAPEISWYHTLRLFLVGVRKRSSLCTISTNNFWRPKKPYHNCGVIIHGGRSPTQFNHHKYLCWWYSRPLTSYKSQRGNSKPANPPRQHWKMDPQMEINLLKPNDIYICRTAALTSRRYILNIYSINIHTEYFKHAA